MLRKRLRRWDFVVQPDANSSRLAQVRIVTGEVTPEQKATGLQTKVFGPN